MSLTKATYSMIDGAPVNVLDYGAVGNGVADDTAAIVAANTAAVAAGKTLFFPAGQYLMTSAQTFTGACNWVFEGGTGPLDSIPPPARIIKKSTVAGDLLTFTGQSIVLDGIAILGQVGNTGDGLVLLGNSPVVNRAYIAKMGNDGLRIGKSTVTSVNVNSFYITNPRCVANGRDGINIDDAGINANAGSIINPICTQNGRHGFYGNRAALGVTIIAPTFEDNTGYGAYLDTQWGFIGANVIIGGDIEANTAGNLYQAVAFQTEIVGLSVQGLVINTRAQNGTYTPVITGGTSAGVGTYTTRQGSYSVSGGSVDFFANIVWTSHTGTGQIYISLPLSIYTSAPVPDFIPVSVVTSGLTFSAGAQAYALVSRTGNRAQLYVSNAGALSALTLAAAPAGTLYISGSYPANVPNYNYLP